MEGEVTLVVFPKLYKKCASALGREVDEETGESAGDVFVRVEGKLERGDRGNQVICMAVEPLVLDEKSNRPKVMEVNIPASLLTRPYMDSPRLDSRALPGPRPRELRVESTSGDVMRMELPTRIDARNMVLLAEMIDLVGRQGKVLVA